VGRVEREARASTVARLEALRATGSLTTAHIRLAASGHNVTERTVWRWLGPAPAVAAGRRYWLCEADREAFAHYRGNIAAVHRARDAVVCGVGQVAGAAVADFLVTGWASAPSVTMRTLQRAFERELTPAEQAAWREGEHARRAAQVYLTRSPAARNQVWEADHKDLPILVLPPRGPAVRPWLTSVIDDGTRAVLGWALALTPHSGTVLTALRMALVHEEQRGPFGGVPGLVRVDRGLDFAAEAVRDALAALVIDQHRLPGYTPHRKGKVERIHRTIEQTLLCGLPGYTDGPRDAAGVLYGPVSDAPAARAAAEEAAAGGQAAPMRIERFAARFAAWVAWYNTERPHAGLDGRTPLQAWNEDGRAVHRIDAERVRHLLLAGVERIIEKDGIHFNSLCYIAPALQGRRGQRVHVRYMPHDDRSIEVYLDGAHLCTAYPQGQLSEQQVSEFREHARAETRRLGAARRKAARRARIELVPLTDTDTSAGQARLVPAEHAAGMSRHQRDELLRARSATDLLGLTDPLAPTTHAAPPVALDSDLDAGLNSEPDAGQER
jgi:putative transposase